MSWEDGCWVEESTGMPDENDTEGWLRRFFRHSNQAQQATDPTTKSYHEREAQRSLDKVPPLE